MKIVMKEEGVSGFYNGVAAVMLGQAVIKAVAFGSNNWALSIQGSHHYSILEVLTGILIVFQNWHKLSLFFAYS